MRLDDLRVGCEPDAIYFGRPATREDIKSVVLEEMGGVEVWLCHSVMAPRCKEGQPPVFGPEGHDQCGRFLIVYVDAGETE
jgi:hypothetical protein